MTIMQWLKELLTSHYHRTEVAGAPKSLNEYEKQSVQETQEDLSRTLKILEIEAKVLGYRK